MTAADPPPKAAAATREPRPFDSPPAVHSDPPAFHVELLTI